MQNKICKINITERREDETKFSIWGRIYESSYDNLGLFFFVIML